MKANVSIIALSEIHSALIYNIHTHERGLSLSDLCCYPSGTEALGLNYERHYWCRPGYNYQNIKK